MHIVVDTHVKKLLGRFIIDINSELPILNLKDVFELVHSYGQVHVLKGLEAILHNHLFVFFINDKT